MPAGGDASGDGGTMAWTLGQADAAFLGAPAGSMAQGVQQPVEAITVGLAATGAGLFCSVWPNPTAGDVALALAGAAGASFRYQVLDPSGRRLAEGAVGSSPQIIPFRAYPPAPYLIRIQGSDGTSALLPVIKH